ncbi:MAG: glucosidase [Bacteroidetes bacterium]|nr:glucosidase [Bacteroidota bacterium]
MEEKNRLAESNSRKVRWKKWGPYLSERQWGTVREDYSANGDAWNYITHDQSRSKAYRWGEEGIGGICDTKQLLCFSVAFWNGKDPILKDSFFGLSNPQGNHGEDVKEYYYYLDNTPTHSYMKMLYKYPQEEFPYEHLVEKNKNSGKLDPEFELIDTGVFDDDKYFDVFIEYAKEDAENILIKITILNRGKETALINVIPQLWFRNTWSWGHDDYKPLLSSSIKNIIEVNHRSLGKYFLFCDGEPELLFCENETNFKKLYGMNEVNGFFKDGINDYVVDGNKNAVNTSNKGTKAAANYRLVIDHGKSATLRLRLSNKSLKNSFENFDSVFDKRKEEADEFYTDLLPKGWISQNKIKDKDLRNIQRQAFAGMLWCKQFYYYDIRQWLNGDPSQPSPPEERNTGRNSDWIHLNNADIISMPDKWEYPWYASWDLAFHCIPLVLIDPEFAKRQLKLLTKEWYMHPNGQFPAYEWNFNDVNPPVHAWAAWRIYKIDKKNNDGKGDIEFLEAMFHKLLLNFTWWVNRKDKDNRNIFQGGFLGLDNIGVFDRSAELPSGGFIEQSDATSWMAMYCLNMMRISLELSMHNPVYQNTATKFFEHFLFIAGAMANIGNQDVDLWDEEDQFFYDVLNVPGKSIQKIKIHSIVGLIPLFAVEVLEPDLMEAAPEFWKRLEWFLNYRKDLSSLVSRWDEPGYGERRLLSLLRGHRMKMLLKRMLDESEFLSNYGIRSLSKFHKDNPYKFSSDGYSSMVNYEPAESESNMFGGNSNWRGPVWFPLNYLIIESLQEFHHYYGDDFKVEYPTGSGKIFTIKEISEELANRLIKIFVHDGKGKRPVFGDNKKFQTDPNFKDYIPFFEYFHGDNGKGLGASHQTGWTGLIAKLIQPSE